MRARYPCTSVSITFIGYMQRLTFRVVEPWLLPTVDSRAPRPRFLVGPFLGPYGLPYRGTSLIRNRTHLGPYSRTMHMVLRRS